MVFAHGNTSLTASRLLMLLNMLINMTFIINITFFSYIGTVLSSKSKPGPNISLKRLHTCQCQPRVWHFLVFIFTVFKNTSYWQKLSEKHSLHWLQVIFLLIQLALFAELFQASPEKLSLASTSRMCARVYAAQPCWAAAAVSYTYPQIGTAAGSANGEL